jgi:hypothetical protein
LEQQQSHSSAQLGEVQQALDAARVKCQHLADSVAALQEEVQEKEAT